MASGFARRILTSSLLLLFIPACTPTATTMPAGVTIINSCTLFRDYDAQCTGTNGNCAFFVKSNKFTCKDWCESQQSTCVSGQKNKGGYKAKGDDRCTGEGSVSTDCTLREYNQICTCKKIPIRTFYIIRLSIIFAIFVSAWCLSLGCACYVEWYLSKETIMRTTPLLLLLPLSTSFSLKLAFSRKLLSHSTLGTPMPLAFYRAPSMQSPAQRCCRQSTHARTLIIRTIRTVNNVCTKIGTALLMLKTGQNARTGAQSKGAHASHQKILHQKQAAPAAQVARRIVNRPGHTNSATAKAKQTVRTIWSYCCSCRVAYSRGSWGMWAWFHFNHGKLSNALARKVLSLLKTRIVVL